MLELNAGQESALPAVGIVVYIGRDLAIQSRLSVLLRAVHLRVKMLDYKARLTPSPESNPPIKGALLDLASLSAAEVESTLLHWQAQLPQEAVIVPFGPHVLTDRLEAAAKAGCELVLTRGQCLEKPELWLPRMA